MILFQAIVSAFFWTQKAIENMGIMLHKGENGIISSFFNFMVPFPLKSSKNQIATTNSMNSQNKQNTIGSNDKKHSQTTQNSQQNEKYNKNNDVPKIEHMIDSSVFKISSSNKFSFFSRTTNIEGTTIISDSNHNISISFPKNIKISSIRINWKPSKVAKDHCISTISIYGFENENNFLLHSECPFKPSQKVSFSPKSVDTIIITLKAKQKTSLVSTMAYDSIDVFSID